MLEEVQHFGITVGRPLETLRFYNDALMFPFVSLNVVSGRLPEELYQLKKPVNCIAWYQFPGSAMELFYLPTHPARNSGVGDLRLPGYRYAGYRVEGLDAYIERLERRGVSFRVAECGGLRALLTTDPSGIHVVLFERSSGGGARALGLEEAGLTVANPDAYAEYFRLIGLPEAPEENDVMAEVLRELFELESAPRTLRFGHIRLLHFPGANPGRTQSFFPSSGAISPHHFNDVGVRHVAYRVEDAQAFYEHARAGGVQFLFEPKLVTGGSVIAYFLDPEGNTIEIMQTAPGSDKFMKTLGSIYAEGTAIRSRVEGFFNELFLGKTLL